MADLPGSKLDVWFKGDIENALRAVTIANADVFDAIEAPDMDLYRRGYMAAIRAMAEAFGVRYNYTREER